jgi:hypothetical protein
MSPATTSFLISLAENLSWVMQVSILVPMVVVWRRRRYFPPAVRLLSWYVYLSLVSVLGARVSEFYHLSNWLAVAGFNLGKIALLGGVFYLALHQARARSLVALTTLATLVFGLYSMWQLGIGFLLTYARVTQCAVLAAFALAYLEQLSREAPAGRLGHNPLFLVSVGQLFYSAGTVMYFSMDFNHMPSPQLKFYFGIVAILGLIFNFLLTLAFLRARSEPDPLAISRRAASQMVNA